MGLKSIDNMIPQGICYKSGCLEGTLYGVQLRRKEYTFPRCGLSAWIKAIGPDGSKLFHPRRSGIGQLKTLQLKDQFPNVPEQK